MALAEARLAVLDTAACILVGAESASAQAIVGMLAGSGGSGVGARALMLGTAAHALDFDDYEPLGSTHPSAAIVPALLAMAERRAFTHAQVLHAYVSGYETILYAGAALGYGHYLTGWHASGTLGGIGAAAASAHLLHLNRDRFAAALSLAMTQASGMKAQFGSGTKALHCGLAARAGIEAALMAEAGMTASAGAAEGETGFLAMYGTSDSPGWGADWPTIESCPPFRKPWPSCAYTHRIVEAAERIAAQPGFDAARVRAGRIHMPKPYHDVAGFLTPRTPDEARFSTVFCAASTLVDGALSPASFTVEAIRRPAVQRLAAALEPDLYPLPEGVGDVSPDAPDTLRLELTGGTVLSETVAHLRGGPASPLGADAVLAKYSECGGDAAAGRAYLSAPPDAPFAAPEPKSLAA